MNATRFEFRFRAPIILLLYVIGFVAPWRWLFAEPNQGETWGMLIAQLNRTHLLSFNNSFVLVNVLVLMCAFAGALLRWRATAFIGAETKDGVIYGTGLYTNAWLHAGTWLLAVPITILMRPSGAAFLMATLTLFLLRLAGAEKVILPGSVEKTLQPWRKPDWLKAGLVECYGLLLAVSFAVFCWSFNAQLLLRCAIICFGVSLVVNAVFVPRRTSRPGSPVIY